MWRRVFVVAAFGACGDNRAGVTSPPDADSGTVSLTITFRGQPAPGRAVYFQEADGTLVAAVPTDDNGVARATVGSGGYVTTINPFGQVSERDTAGMFDDIRTFADVKPGDQLKIHVDPSTALSVNLQVPLDPAAVSWNVVASCGSSLPGTFSPVEAVDCGAMADFGVMATENNGYRFLFATDIPVPMTDNGNIDLSSRTYDAEVSDATVTWTHIPPLVGMDIQTAVETGRGPVFTATDNIPIGGDTESLTQSLPQLPGTTWSVLSATGTPDGTLDQFLYNWGASGSNITVDFTDAVGPISDYSGSGGTMTWTAGAGAPPDVVDVFINAYRCPMPDKCVLRWRWELAGPPDGTSVTFPTLAGPLEPYNLLPDDLINGVSMTVANVPGGYDALRADIMATHGRVAVPVGQSGHMSYAKSLFDLF